MPKHVDGNGTNGFCIQTKPYNAIGSAKCHFCRWPRTLAQDLVQWRSDGWRADAMSGSCVRLCCWKGLSLMLMTHLQYLLGHAPMQSIHFHLAGHNAGSVSHLQHEASAILSRTLLW